MSEGEEPGRFSFDEIAKMMGWSPEEVARREELSAEMHRYNFEMTEEEREKYFHPERDIADAIRDHARVGSYVSLDLLGQMDFVALRQGLGKRGYEGSVYEEEVKNARHSYTTNIRHYGNDAIAHLCIPDYALVNLYRRQGLLHHLPTLSAFERFFKANEKNGPDSLIKPGADRYAPETKIIFDRYKEWVSIRFG